jgi:hypothetical protein
VPLADVIASASLPCFDQFFSPMSHSSPKHSMAVIVRSALVIVEAVKERF